MVQDFELTGSGLVPFVSTFGGLRVQLRHLRFQSAPREGELPLYDRGGIELHSHT